MNKQITKIIAENQKEISKNLPQIITDAACARVDAYAQKANKMIKSLGSEMVHVSPILREDFQNEVKCKIKGEPGTGELGPDEDALADKQAALFIDRAAERYTDPEKYQPL